MRMLKRAAISLLKLTVFIALVWLAVTLYWQYTDHVVSSEDLLIYFLILPVALLLTYFVTRTVWWASKKTLGGRQTPTAAVPLSGLAVNGVSRSGHAGETPSTYVLANAISTYFGDDHDGFLSAILDDKLRVEIDAAFTQELGYGVRVARVDQLDVVSPHQDIRITVLRTSALLQRIYAQLEDLLIKTAPASAVLEGTGNQLRGIHLHPEWRGGALSPQSVVQSGQDETQRASMPTNLSVHIVLPVFLSPIEASLIQAEIMSWLEMSGWPTKAVSAITIQPENEVEYFRVLQAWQQGSDPPGGNEWLLVLSAMSWLDTDLLNDRLYKEPQFADQLAKGGSVIGELACGMVFAKMPPAAELQLDPFTRLSGWSVGQRNKPVDAKGSIEADLLNEMLAAQQLALPEPAPLFLGVVASGDLNNRRVVELGRWVTDSLPQLDFIGDVLCVAEHIGECEPAGSVLALGLASAMAQQRAGSVLFCANQPPNWRMLATVSPVI